MPSALGPCELKLVFLLSDWLFTKLGSLILFNSLSRGSEESDPRSRVTVAATAMNIMTSLWELQSSASLWLGIPLC